jgi:colanic acid/amylovoran biosynthesis glycosyltransferase
MQSLTPEVLVHGPAGQNTPRVIREAMLDRQTHRPRSTGPHTGKVAYLVNQYPKISHTFIRREIEALERAGVEVMRFSMRRSPDRLISTADQREAARTTILLDAGLVGLALCTLRTLFRRWKGFLSALRLSIQMSRRSERGLLRNLAYLGEACLLLEHAEREKIRHIHAHFGTNSTSVAMLCNALGGPSYSFTAHGPEEFDKAELWHICQKIERASFVIAISSFGRSQLYRHCSPDHWSKIEVVHCGVDATFLEAPSMPVPAAPRLVSVGRLSEQKGQLLLLEALGELHRRGRSFELTLVGDGELRPAVEDAIARLGLRDKVRLAGWANEAEVRQMMLDARALVVPSFAEGLPVVIMEALALGRPVVSTYVGGIPELVLRNCGWLVPAGSRDDLVAALEEVLTASPDTLEALGKAGRARVRARHEIGQIGEQIGTLIRQFA